MGKLTGKVAIITGCSSGMGRATARLFAKEGAKIVMGARREDRGAELERELRDAGYEATYVRTDVSVPADCTNLVEKAVELYNRIDILCNIAGQNGKCLYNLHEAPEEMRDRLVKTDLYGIIDTCSAAIPHMIEQNYGVIVNISSVAAVIGMPKDCLYSAVKGAVKSLSVSMACLYGPMGIRVNCICPGLTDTEMGNAAALKGSKFADAILGHTPLHRFGTADELANAILFLASDDSSFVCGEVLVVDGGEAIS